MPIHVVLEGEDREQVAIVYDTQGIIGFFASAAKHDTTYRLLRYIDPYGDTVFNRLQAEDLLADLRLAQSHAASEAEKTFLEQVAALVERIDEEPHLYVRFMGD